MYAAEYQRQFQHAFLSSSIKFISSFLENILHQVFFKVKTIFKFSCKIYSMNTIFRQRLKELRTSKGLSQQKLGEIIGATCSAVSYWEKGINEPKLSYIINLAKLFEVSSDYLLGLED